MLIYNHKKEFLGISESDLKTFGLSDLEELKSLTDDFANLFIKSTGYIYNFQHIHWIDYIACSSDTAEHKAKLKVKEKEYAITITIDMIYLFEDPLQKAYCINLNSAKKEATTIQTPTPQVAQQIFTQKEVVKKGSVANEESRVPPVELDLAFDIPETKKDEEDINFAFDIPDEKQIQSTMAHDVENHNDKDRFSSYVYNLQKASDTLGLPVDLVAEFIEDYTTQANSFKDKLYISLENEDFTALKTETHKLIGVAENLKIENALDVLAKISKSQNQEALKLYLDRYFQIIDELSSKSEVKTAHEAHETNPPLVEKSQEHLTLTFKEDTAPASSKTPTSIDTEDLLPLEFK